LVIEIWNLFGIWDLVLGIWEDPTPEGAGFFTSHFSLLSVSLIPFGAFGG